MKFYNPHVSIILPTFNESESIVQLIKQILSVTANHKLIAEVLLVDDNSPDGTGKIVKKAFAQRKNVRVILRKHDPGLAPSIKHGIKSARSSIVIVMDSDFNHDPHAIPALYKYSKKFDIVIGSRFVKGGGMEERSRYYLSFLFNLFVKNYLHLSTSDNLSGFFAASKKLLTPYLTPEIFSGFGEYFIRLLYLLQKKNSKCKEIPVYYILRHYGRRKSQFLKMFLTYTKAAIKLKQIQSLT